MNLHRYLERLRRMDDLIRRKATGNPKEFAEKMGISRSGLMEYIKLLKALNAPIAYDNVRGSYYYLFSCKLKLGYESKFLSDEELKGLSVKNIEKFCQIISVRK